MFDYPQGIELDKSTPASLSKADYDSIHYLMVEQPPHSKKWYIGGIRASFTDQIADITAETDPDCYLFTAYSAIPVADAVRSFYASVDRECPQLSYIYANRSITLGSDAAYNNHLHNEAERLSGVLGDLGSVCIVEQYTERRRVLNLAIDIVRKIGIHTISAFDNCNWYHNAVKDEVDLNRLTSSHYEFMALVGTHAAQKVLEGTYNHKPAKEEINKVWDRS